VKNTLAYLLKYEEKGVCNKDTWMIFNHLKAYFNKDLVRKHLQAVSLQKVSFNRLRFGQMS